VSEFKKKVEEFDSFLLAALYVFLNWYLKMTMKYVYRLFGLRKEDIRLRHADVYLLTTTSLISVLICVSQVWINLGWALIILGNIRILQIICLNTNLLLFGWTPFSDTDKNVRQTRWHLLALWFSFVDIILIFAFMYQFFDSKFSIMNEHSHNFIDYLYYAIVTMVTLGYGDLVTVTHFGRMITIYEIFVALFFMTFVVAGAVGRFQRNL
jgi:hypothetical protein